LLYNVYMEEPENNKIEEQKSEGGTGAMIGVIIIIIVLLVGIWYFVTNKLEQIEEQKIQNAIIEAQNSATTTINLGTTTITE
jgi:preprotein translocase subunit YajC